MQIRSRHCRLRHILLAALAVTLGWNVCAMATDPFTVALLPDTQYYVNSSRIHHFTNQTQWLVNDNYTFR